MSAHRMGWRLCEAGNQVHKNSGDGLGWGKLGHRHTYPLQPFILHRQFMGSRNFARYSYVLRDLSDLCVLEL